MAKKFIIDPEYLKRHPVSFTVVRGKTPKRVAIPVETVVETTDGIGGPAKKVTVPGATQADLALLFEQGHKYIIEVSDDGTPSKFATDKNIAATT